MCSYKEQTASEVLFCRNGDLYTQELLLGCIRVSAPQLAGKCPYCGGGYGSATVIPLFLLERRPLITAGVFLHAK